MHGLAERILHLVGMLVGGRWSRGVDDGVVLGVEVGNEFLEEVVCSALEAEYDKPMSNDNHTMCIQNCGSGGGRRRQCDVDNKRLGRVLGPR